VSRSEGTNDHMAEPSPEGGVLDHIHLQSRHDEVEVNELDIRLRISYRTILIVFVAFNVGNRVLNAFF
jgi:hypothetical protein